MKNLNLQKKIVYPILGAFALVTALGSWYFVSRQIKETESWYRQEFRTLTVSSGLMGHGAAEEFVRIRGLRFHKVPIRKNSIVESNSEIETRAAAAFECDPNMQFFEDEIPVKDTLYLAVFTATKYKQECRTCHMNTGTGSILGKMDENEIALFGVSGSLADLRAQESKTEIFALLGTLIIIGGLGWFVNRSMKTILLEPMQELKLQAEVVANCDLRKLVTPALERKLASNDEMGHVTRSFATMIYVLRRIISRVLSTSHEVADATSQINTSMEKMAAGAQEQMGLADDVAKAIEEMTRTIAANSRSASETADTAQKARATAEAGGKIVSATVEGMKRIERVTNKNSETTQTLAQSSKRIGEIVKLISDIARQTNLLALNAATEAARAGEKGKGFAVVADEVRKLAERTMKATKDIEEMIKIIQRDTHEAVRAIDEGAQEVKEGIKLVDEAGRSLREIVGVSQKVTDMITQIAAASEEQATSSEEISKHVEIISSVTRRMASETSEIANAADSLNHLTAQLREVVNEFKLSEEDQQTEMNPTSTSENLSQRLSSNR